MRRSNRIWEEIQLVGLWFHLDYDTDNFSWIRILNFPLRNRPEHPATDILLKIPYQYPVVPPEHFFLDRHLNLGSHYSNSFNELGHKGWAQYCLHLDGWKPSSRNILDGDSLITVLECIKTILDMHS